MRTAQYRYTEWVRFQRAQFRPIWDDLYGAELYDHDADPEENVNLAFDDEYDTIRDQLSAQLRADGGKSLTRDEIITMRINFGGTLLK